MSQIAGPSAKPFGPYLTRQCCFEATPEPQGRAVTDDDDLDIALRLPEGCGHGTPEEDVDAVIGRDRNGNTDRAHPCGAPASCTCHVPAVDSVEPRRKDTADQTITMSFTDGSLLTPPAIHDGPQTLPSRTATPPSERRSLTCCGVSSV